MAVPFSHHTLLSSYVVFIRRKMKLAIAALCAASAAAFAPAKTGRVATDLAVSELEVSSFRALSGAKKDVPAM